MLMQWQKMVMMTMTGKIQLEEIFKQQIDFQKKVSGLDTPVDSQLWFSYHMQAMTEELGEVLKSDKRWKTHRNAFYDKENKLEELADVFITTINLSLFSGFTADDIANAIHQKIQNNNIKFDRSLEDDSNSGRNKQSR